MRSKVKLSFFKRSACLAFFILPVLPSFFKSPVKLEGELVAISFDNFSPSSSRLEYYLLVPQGKYYLLRFGSKPPQAHPGVKARITGDESGGKVFLDPADPEAFQVLSGSPPPTATVRTVAVVMVNFKDDDRQPYSPGEVRQIIFSGSDSVAAYFLQQSSLGLQLEGYLDPENGDVFGWYTLKKKNKHCDFIGWSEAACELAMVDGYQKNHYTNTIYLFPRSPDCDWTGAAHNPGDSAWINSDSLLKTGLVQELEHNFSSLKPGFSGDVNGDGRVDFLDLMAILRLYGRRDAVGWPEDLIGDGLVNFLDAAYLSSAP